jgi:uroporphyrinogen-III synthase
MRLIVTRPREQAEPAVRELRSFGIDAVALPLIAIAALGGDASSGSDGEALEALRRSWARLHEQRLVMFVSANAVTRFFAAAPPHAAWPAEVWAGSTGPGTTAALRAAGVPAACVRAPAADALRLDSEALWQQLRGADWQGARVLVVRGDGGRDWLSETLRHAGAHVEQLAAYRRELPRLAPAEAALLADASTHPENHAWHFGSSEAVRNLPRLAAADGWRRSLAYATHERIAEAARAIGFERVELLAPGVAALVHACKQGPKQA